MDCKDLMVGDWVSCNDLKRQVAAIGETVGFLDCDNQVYWAYEGFDRIDPIPLTEDILVKNGFHTYGESYFIPEDKCNAHVRIGFHKRETVVDLHRHGAFSVQISCKPGKLYIHQLQRLLNLCNIDKEIIL